MILKKLYDFTHKFKKTTVSMVLLFGCLLIYRKFITFDKLYIYHDTGSDTFNAYWPFINDLLSKIKEGTIPFWSLNMGIGSNYYATQSFIGDIFIYLYLLLGNNDPAYAFGFMAILKIIISGLLFYTFIRYLKVGYFAALIGALLYSFNGYIILWGQHYQFVNIMLYAPLFLYGFERLLKVNKWGVYVLSVFIIAINSYYFLYIFSLFFLLYALVRYLIVNKFSISHFLKFTLKASLYYLLGISLASFLLIPTIYSVLQSPRITGSLQVPLLHLNDINYYISLVFRVLSNNSLGISDNYYGYFNYYESPILYTSIFSLIIIPQFFLHLGKKEKILYSSLYVLLIIFTIFPYFASMFNAFNKIDYRWTFVIIIYNVFVATLSLDNLNKFKFRTSFNVFCITLFIIILLPLISLYSAGNQLQWTSKNMSSSLIVIVKSILLGILYISLLSIMKKYNITILKVILFITIFSELILSSYFTVNHDRVLVDPSYISNKEGYYDSTNEAVKFLNETDKTFFRTNKDYSSGLLNDALMQNYNGFNSYNSLNNSSYLEFLKELNVPVEWGTALISGLEKRPMLETLLSNKYFISKNDQVPAGYEVISKFNEVYLSRNKNFLPLGFTYDSFINYEQFKILTKEQKDLILLKAFVKGPDDKNISNQYTEISEKTLNDSPPVNISLEKANLNVENIEINKNNFPSELEFTALTEDPNLIISSLNKISGNISFSFDAASVGESMGQIYWKGNGNQFSELNSTKFNLLTGKNHYSISLGNLENIESIRLDLSNNPGNFNISKIAILSTNIGINENDIKKLKKESLKINKFNDNHFKGDIHLDSNKMLFFSIPYDKGWKVKIDNKISSIKKVNIAFIGIPLEKGYHTIELSFIPPYFKIGALISGLSIIMIIFLMILSKIRIRKQTIG